MKKETDTFKF